MRWIPPFALAIWLAIVPASGQSTNSDEPVMPQKFNTPTNVQQIKAEPESGADDPLITRQPEGPSKEDVGPILIRFARASNTDNLAATQNDDNASLLIPEKTAIDKRITIPKIHDVENNGTITGNTALDYETTYLNWGAVTGSQYSARRGHYFTITWKNSGPRADFVARFQYREVRSKEIVRTLTQPAPHVRGATRSYFAVVDKAYAAYGPVASWRFTILKGDTVVAEAKSFVW